MAGAGASWQRARPERRQAHRRVLAQPAIVYAEGRHDGHVLDVSNSGVLVEISNAGGSWRVQQHAVIDISLPLELSSMWMRAHGTIRRVEGGSRATRIAIVIERWESEPAQPLRWEGKSA